MKQALLDIGVGLLLIIVLLIMVVTFPVWFIPLVAWRIGKAVREERSG